MQRTRPKVAAHRVGASAEQSALAALWFVHLGAVLSWPCHAQFRRALVVPDALARSCQMAGVFPALAALRPGRSSCAARPAASWRVLLAAPLPWPLQRALRCPVAAPDAMRVALC